MTKKLTIHIPHDWEAIPIGIAIMLYWSPFLLQNKREKKNIFQLEKLKIKQKRMYNFQSTKQQQQHAHTSEESENP